MNAKTILILWDESVDEHCISFKLYESILRVNEDPDKRCTDLKVIMCRKEDFDRILEQNDPIDYFVLQPARFLSSGKVMRVFVNDPAIHGLNKPIWGAVYSVNLGSLKRTMADCRIRNISEQVQTWIRKGTDRGAKDLMYPWGPVKSPNRRRKSRDKVRIDVSFAKSYMKGCWPEMGV